MFDFLTSSRFPYVDFYFTLVFTLLKRPEKSPPPQKKNMFSKNSILED